MTDRELLELAAKAAGYKLNFHNGYAVNVTDFHPAQNVYGAKQWNPLTDDGDAFRLAVRLSLNVNIYNLVVSYENADEYIEKHFPQGVIYDVAEATRRAITRVAAEIGRSM